VTRAGTDACPSVTVNTGEGIGRTHRPYGRALAPSHVLTVLFR